ncbi:hypothetical protein B0H16DRAFT_1745258 [Mycena metata]|uniref:Uncharacterized protein n=1 Tax=Mycena metata TaxID=1033252 RepID=A0AAD7H3V2_9AGAR|nr:hypothetical protein B0H16DRAFT_1745258 [Mycena metata]
MSPDWAWKQATLIPTGAPSSRSLPGAIKPLSPLPVYVSPGVLTGTACRAHGNGVLPVAFLVIPKTSKKHRKKPASQKFVCQMYHASLARIFEPLKQHMTTPDIVRCPDGHFCRVIYDLGPYIADYPEQVWLAGIVQNWCPRSD